MNNTPLKWNNQTTFVPAKPPERTMSTFEHLENAEASLRNALRSSDDTSRSDKLRDIVDLISRVEQVKESYRPRDFSNFSVAGDYEPFYGMYSTCQLDSININAAQPVIIPGASGSDVITFS